MDTSLRLVLDPASGMEDGMTLLPKGANSTRCASLETDIPFLMPGPWGFFPLEQVPLTIVMRLLADDEPKFPLRAFHAPLPHRPEAGKDVQRT